MSETTVSREVVLRVLNAANVDVLIGENGEVTLAKEGVVIETIILPDRVEKRMLFRFQRKYGVPIHWFWNPTMIPPPESTRIQ